MSTVDGSPAEREAGVATRLWRKRLRPTTRLGRTAGWLALAFLVWSILNQTLFEVRQPLDGPPLLILLAISWLGIGAGLVGSVLALLAVTRRGERSIIAFVALLPGLLAIAFALGEILVPH